VPDAIAASILRNIFGITKQDIRAATMIQDDNKTENIQIAIATALRKHFQEIYKNSVNLMAQKKAAEEKQAIDQRKADNPKTTVPKDPAKRKPLEKILEDFQTLLKDFSPSATTFPNLKLASTAGHKKSTVTQKIIECQRHMMERNFKQLPTELVE